MPAAVAKMWTEEELLALPSDGKHELVDGELVFMSPAGGFHGRVSSRLGGRLTVFVEDRGLGGVYDGQTGFWMKSGNLRAPDVSFVAQEKLDKLGASPEGFFKFAPDLAVEVLSPSESMKDMQGKIDDYFASGTRLVWVLIPRIKGARIFHERKRSKLLRADESLSGEDVVPGFSIRLSDLYRGV